MYKVEEAQRGKSVALLCRKILDAGATAVFKSEKEDCRHTCPHLFNSIVNKTFLAPVSLTSFLSTRLLSPFHLLVLSELPLATLCTTLVFSRPTSQRAFVRFGLCPSLIRQLLYSLWLLRGCCLHRPLLLGRVWHCGVFDLAAQVRLIASPRLLGDRGAPSAQAAATQPPTTLPPLPPPL